MEVAIEIAREENDEQLLNEIGALSRADHPHIVKILDYQLDGDR